MKVTTMIPYFFVLLCVSCSGTTPSPFPLDPTRPLPTKQPSPPLPAEQISSPLPTDQVGNGEILHQGSTLGGNEFQVRYASDVWEYTEIGFYPEPVLLHRWIAGCRLNLREGARDWLEPDIRETVNLAGYEWTRDTHSTVTGGWYILYYAAVKDISFLFALIQQDPLPEDQATQCLEDGETVLDTLQPR